MEKSVKNSSQLTDKQRQIVDDIILTVGARLYHLLKTMADPQEFTKLFLRFIRSKENLSLCYLSLDIKNRCGPDKAFFPSDLNQQLAMALAKESSQYLKGPALRKILKILEGEGILLNISGRKNVKHNAGNLVKQRKGGGGDYKSSKHQGQYSAYKVTTDVQDLLEIMSNPPAIQIIHSTLKSSGLLNKVFEKLFFVIVHIFNLSKDDETTQNSILRSMLPLGPHHGMDDSKINNLGLQGFATILSSVNDETLLQYLASKFADALIEDPLSNTLYLVFSLPRL
jgi:hypothetical protein